MVKESKTNRNKQTQTHTHKRKIRIELQSSNQWLEIATLRMAILRMCKDCCNILID